MSRGKRLNEYEQGKIDGMRQNSSKTTQIAQRIKISVTVVIY
jgi:hypothetical protein